MLNSIQSKCSPTSRRLFYKSVSSPVQLRDSSKKENFGTLLVVVVVAVTVARYVQTPWFTAHARPSVMT